MIEFQESIAIHDGSVGTPTRYFLRGVVACSVLLHNRVLPRVFAGSARCFFWVDHISRCKG